MSHIVKKNLTALFVFALLSSTVFADEHVVHPRKTMEISLNPLKLALGYLPLNFTIALTHKMALGLHAYGRFFGFGETKIHGAGGGVSFKFFLSGSAISDSWFVEPGLDAGYSNYDKKGYWSLSPSVIAGYTWVWDSGFLINLGLGAEYTHAFVDKGFISKDSFGLQGILPTGEFSLGWAW